MESLLDGDGSGETASADVTEYKFPQNFGRLDENKSSTIASHQAFAQSRLFHLLFKVIWIWNLVSFLVLLIFCDDVFQISLVISKQDISSRVENL